MSGPKGTAHPSSKLTEDQVREIRRLLKAGQSLAELAKRFGVSRTAIRNIGNGRRWQLGEVHRQPPRVVVRQPIWSPRRSDMSGIGGEAMRRRRATL